MRKLTFHAAKDQVNQTVLNWEGIYKEYLNADEAAMMAAGVIQTLVAFKKIDAAVEAALLKEFGLVG